MAYYGQCQQYDFFYCILFILMVKLERGGEVMEFEDYLKSNSEVKRFKDYLKSYRELKKYTRSQMANKLGMTSTAYGAYELGNREPNLDKLCDIAKILEVTPNDLLGYKPDESVEYSHLQKEFHRFGFDLMSNGTKSADGRDLYVLVNLEEKDSSQNSIIGLPLTLEIYKNLFDGIFQTEEYKSDVHFLIIQASKMIEQEYFIKPLFQYLNDFVDKESNNPKQKGVTDFLRKLLKSNPH